MWFNKDGRYAANEIVAPKGSKTMTILPDGSTVWLNAEIAGIRQKVSIDVENVNTNRALDNLSAQTGLTYRFMANNLIVIKEDTGKINADKKTTGRIIDQAGQPLSGASGHINGTGVLLPTGRAALPLAPITTIYWYFPISVSKPRK